MLNPAILRPPILDPFPRRRLLRPDGTGVRPGRALFVLLQVVIALALAAAACARAGVLQAGNLRERFAPPYVVGEKATDVPVWPIFKQNGPATDLIGYVFESIDLAPIPGFSGTPLNLLIAMNPEGEFLDVKVLSHHEPVFLDGLGEEPLFRFVSQYKGLSLKQNIKIGAHTRDMAQSTNVYIDGVAKATASVRIINQTMLSAALKIARAKLHYSASKEPELIAHVRPELFEPMDWNALLGSGLVAHRSLRGRDVEAAFTGTIAARHPMDAEPGPQEVFTDLYAAFVDIPSVGRNLFDEAALAALRARSHDDDHVLLLLSNGPYAFLGDDHVRGSVPDRLGLRQDNLPIELRDMDLELVPRGAPPFAMARVFRIIGASSLDLGQPVELDLRVTRSVGVVYPERIARDFALSIRVPERYLVPAADDQKGWQSIWRARAGEIAVLLLALLFLSVVLAKMPPLVTRFDLLRRFRPPFLLFTLGFIGWYAQAQLSIVNLVALLQASLVGRSWTFFLYDPLGTILWGYVIASLFVWGRGAFCGWLCPYGALQELVALAARLLRVPVIRMRRVWDARLKWLKYAILAAITAGACVSTALSDRLVEVEPFKTAITLLFVRSWPYAAYAAGLVLLGVFVNKFFCRYLCPLGAALALLGRMRRWDWIARRSQCGTPCQTCRHRCSYQAIDPGGRIQYDECFQCMDCVAIYRSDQECAPLLFEAKRHRTILLAQAGLAGEAR